MEDMDGTETWEVGLGDMGDRDGGHGNVVFYILILLLRSIAYVESFRHIVFVFLFVFVNVGVFLFL